MMAIKFSEFIKGERMKKVSEINMILDEKELQVNELFYTPKPIKMGNDYHNNFKGRGDIEIEAWRVITVNNTHRHFRVRNASGCEREYSLKDGCICDNLYSTVERTIEKGLEKFDRDIANHDKKIDFVKTVEASRKELLKKRKKFERAKPKKLPKRVK